jgi:hypothetical protein
MKKWLVFSFFLAALALLLSLGTVDELRRYREARADMAKEKAEFDEMKRTYEKKLKEDGEYLADRWLKAVQSPHADEYWETLVQHAASRRRNLNLGIAAVVLSSLASAFAFFKYRRAKRTQLTGAS